MADKQEKILDIKVNYSEAIKAIAEYQTKIDAAREAESKLKKQLKDGEISRQQYNEEMAASKAILQIVMIRYELLRRRCRTRSSRKKSRSSLRCFAHSYPI